MLEFSQTQRFDWTWVTSYTTTEMKQKPHFPSLESNNKKTDVHTEAEKFKPVLTTQFNKPSLFPAEQQTRLIMIKKDRLYHKHLSSSKKLKRGATIFASL